MDAQILPDVADIAPDSVIKDHAGNFFPGSERIEPNGDERKRFPGRNPREQRGIDHADARVKETRGGGADLAADVGDQAGLLVETDLERSARGTQGQRAKRPALFMRGEERRQIEFGQNVAVVHQHRPGQEQILDVFQTSGRLEQHRFVAEQDRDAPEMRGLRVFGKKPDKFVGQPVRVDHNSLHTRRRDAGQRELAERNSADRDQRLRNLIGQRLQPLSPAGAKDERRADRHAHAAPPGASSRRMIIISEATKPCRR